MIARSSAPRAAVVAPRAIPRANSVAVPRGSVGVAVPRVGPRYVSPAFVGPRYGYTPWYGYRGFAPFAPYAFRPHFSLGFGLFVGYPMAYYSYPYAVPVYGYGAPYGTVEVGPQSQYGGVALEITPADASVTVDGAYAGVVRDFDGSRQPLTLTPGQHHIQIDMNGYAPLAFDVTVQPGQVIPYQGAMKPY